jgi:hypothetical protein
MNIVTIVLNRKYITDRRKAIDTFFEHHHEIKGDDGFCTDLVLIKNINRRTFEINGSLVKPGELALLPRNSAETFMRMMGFRYDILENPTVASLTTLRKEAV